MAGDLTINKFLPRYSSPYTVLKVNKNNVTYVIGNSKDLADYKVHHRQLRGWKIPPKYLLNNPLFRYLLLGEETLPEEEEVDEEEEDDTRPDDEQDLLADSDDEDEFLGFADDVVKDINKILAETRLQLYYESIIMTDSNYTFSTSPPENKPIVPILKRTSTNDTSSFLRELDRLVPNTPLIEDSTLQGFSPVGESTQRKCSTPAKKRLRFAEPLEQCFDLDALSIDDSLSAIENSAEWTGLSLLFASQNEEHFEGFTAQSQVAERPFTRSRGNVPQLTWVLPKRI
jgi:hypothetical protein